MRSRGSGGVGIKVMANNGENFSTSQTHLDSSRETIIFLTTAEAPRSLDPVRRTSVRCVARFPWFDPCASHIPSVSAAPRRTLSESPTQARARSPVPAMPTRSAAGLTLSVFTRPTVRPPRRRQRIPCLPPCLHRNRPTLGRLL